MGGFLSPKSPWVSGLSHLDVLGVPPWLTRPPYISSNVKDVKPPDAQIHVKPVEVIWICAIRAPGKWPLDAPHWNVLETSCHQGNRLHGQIQPRKEDEKPTTSWGVCQHLTRTNTPLPCITLVSDFPRCFFTCSPASLGWSSCCLKQSRPFPSKKAELPSFFLDHHPPWVTCVSLVPYASAFLRPSS